MGRDALIQRTCKDCGLTSANLNVFVKDKGSKFGRRNLCISCCVKRNTKHPKNSYWKTEHQIKKRYNVSKEEYDKNMASSCVCAICKSTYDLCYDHCHTTFKFRGVLCRKCNRAIGQLGDSAETVRKAYEYLQRFEERYPH